VKRLFPTSAAAVAIAFRAAAAVAQPAADAPTAPTVPPTERVAANPMPAARDEFEKLAAQGDYFELGKRLNAASNMDEINRDTDWEELQIVEGGSVFFDFVYIDSLWTLGGKLPEPTASTAKRFAGVIALYTAQQIMIDAPRCGDASAPGHRMDQLLIGRGEIWRYVMSRPEVTRRDLAVEALKLEARTAKLRGNDVALCSGGASELAARVARDPALAQRPLSSSGGDKIEVPAGPPVPPTFVDAKQAEPKQAAIRAQIPGALARLLKLPEAQAPGSAARPPHPASPAR
jgi:hypothetical protein